MLGKQVFIVATGFRLLGLVTGIAVQVASYRYYGVDRTVTVKMLEISNSGLEPMGKTDGLSLDLEGNR